MIYDSTSQLHCLNNKKGINIFGEIKKKKKKDKLLSSSFVITAEQ